MRRTAIVGIASIACVVALGGIAIAASRLAHRDPDRAYGFITRKVDRMMEEIKATDAQRAQINQLKDKLFKEGMALRQNQRSLRRELFANWDAAQVDASDLHAQVDKQIEAFRAFAHDAADASIQLHDLLTPEQRAQLKQELSNHLERGRGMHEPEQE